MKVDNVIIIIIIIKLLVKEIANNSISEIMNPNNYYYCQTMILDSCENTRIRIHHSTSTWVGGKHTPGMTTFLTHLYQKFKGFLMLMAGLM